MKAVEATPGIGRSVISRWVLIAFDESEDRETLTRIVAECGWRPMPCSTLKEAKALLASQSISLVFCQQGLQGGGWFRLFRAASSGARSVPIIVCSRVVDMDSYLDAMEVGAYDFMVRPYCKRDVQWVAEGALLKSAGVLTAAAARAGYFPGRDQLAGRAPEPNVWR
jgi:DNA-binding NtrC family response regulator